MGLAGLARARGAGRCGGGQHAIHRDRLSIVHFHGYWSEVRYGLYVGMLTMSVLAITLLAALAGQRARATGDDDG